MKKLFGLLAVCLSLMVVVYTSAALSQTPAPSQPAPRQAEKVFQGELTKVDSAASTLTVKGAEEMTFSYTDKTEVVGERNIQGLAGKSGSLVKVTYTDQGAKHMATKIETAERK